MIYVLEPNVTAEEHLDGSGERDGKKRPKDPADQQGPEQNGEDYREGV